MKIKIYNSEIKMNTVYHFNIKILDNYSIYLRRKIEINVKNNNNLNIILKKISYKCFKKFKKGD